MKPRKEIIKNIMKESCLELNWHYGRNGWWDDPFQVECEETGEVFSGFLWNEYDKKYRHNYAESVFYKKDGRYTVNPTIWHEILGLFKTWIEVQRRNITIH